MKAKILESRKHLVICSPTNSGKSLLGQLLLLEAVLHGRRAVLVEPLRALAQQQAEELVSQLELLPRSALPQIPKVQLATGDYRLEDELYTDVAPAEGEIVVATPERMDSIMRNPRNNTWISQIGAVVIDEAHLLSDARRGPTLELLIATILFAQAPPRLTLLSATIGQPDLLARWLQPCQIVTSDARTPLQKEVWALDEHEEPNAIVTSTLKEILAEPSHSAIVFVYRRQAADALASALSTELGLPVRSFHSGQSVAERTFARKAFLDGTSRCLVSTTALAMGINLPCTHVVVRDTTFIPYGRLSTQILIQILGRAGRGERSGHGIVLIRPSDEWDPHELADDLKQNSLPPIRSAFGGQASREPRGKRATERDTAAATLVAACLRRYPEAGLSECELTAILGNTLAGQILVSKIPGSIRYLTDPSHAIAYREQDRLKLTTLGKVGVQAMMPLDYIAGLAQLVRDLISIDPQAGLLRRWTGIDHLFVASLLSDRLPKGRRFTEALAERIDGWNESQPLDRKSLLFSEWVMGSAARSRADELLGSLQLAPSHGDAARRESYVRMLSAIILLERCNGVSAVEIKQRWQVPDVEGSEESWRDTMMWLLAGHASMFELRTFYHHLRECCSATDDQIRSTKQALNRIRSSAYDCMESLKYCSPLGPLMRGIRTSRRSSTEPLMGFATLKRLEAAGVSSISQVANLAFEELLQLGIQKRFAKQIQGYLRRRLR